MFLILTSVSPVVYGPFLFCIFPLWDGPGGGEAWMTGELGVYMKAGLSNASKLVSVHCSNS